MMMESLDFSSHRKMPICTHSFKGLNKFPATLMRSEAFLSAGVV